MRPDEVLEMAGRVEVRIEGRPYLTSEDWSRAQAAPESELPPIDMEKFEKSVLKRMGFSPALEAREKYAFAVARYRMQGQGQILGERLREAIADSGFDLRELIWDGKQWIAIPGGSAIRPVVVSKDLAERMAGWGTKTDYEEASSLFQGKWASQAAKDESQGAVA